MYYKRSGYPEEDEIVLCKVTKIFPNSVFALLEEYGESGMIHISEIAPGRIRNLREHVTVGRQIICKVLRIDRERGHIDLSLRRVNSHQRREKLDEIKQELKAESLVKAIAKRLSKKPEEIYKQISKPLFKEYSHLYLAFQDVAAKEVSLEDEGVPKKLASEFTQAILEKFKAVRVTIQGELRLKTFANDGVTQIQKLLKAIEKLSEDITVFYLGAGRFKVIIEADEYKPAEKLLKQLLQLVETFGQDKLATATFEREKNE